MKSKRKFGLFLVLLLLLVTIPLTVWSVKNLRFETRKQASNFESSRNVPVFKGYLIELQNPPLEEYRKNLTLSGYVSNSSLENYQSKLISEHESAKTDVINSLSRTEETPASLIKKEYFRVFNGLYLDNIDPTEIEKVAILPSVKNIYRNLEVKQLLTDSVPLINADDVWLLKDEWGRKVTGNGINVGIIDTGVDYTHPDLGNCSVTNNINDGSCSKVIAGYDIVNGDENPMDDYGHGTHVAGIIAGKGDYNQNNLYEPGQEEIWGIAPDAKITAYKVIDAYGIGYYSNLLTAIEQSVTTLSDSNVQNNINILNLSLGADCGGYFGGYTEECGPDDPASQAVDNAVNAGIIVVVAAGNTGFAGPQSISSPGTARQAITVGATNKLDQIASFSSRGPVSWRGTEINKPDLVAPGEGICAAQYDSFGYQCLDNKHASFSGTSMASPIVAGVAALAEQKYPDLSPVEIKELLKSTALDLGYDINIQGGGRIDALAAILNVAFPTPTPTLPSVSSTIKGHVTLQGWRPNPAQWHTHLKVTVCGQEYLAETDYFGDFEIKNLATGTCDIRVKNIHTLANIKRGVVLNQGENQIGLGTLSEGDVNNDNRINIMDFSVMRPYWMGYNERADLNNDHQVSILDFQLLGFNFGKYGDIEIGNPQSLNIGPKIAGISTGTGVQIKLNPQSQFLTTNDIFSIDVLLADDGQPQPMDGVEVHLDFDPNNLSVVDAGGNPTDQLEINPLFPAVLQKQVNPAGQIDLAAGSLTNPPSTPLILTTIFFKALSPTNGSAIPLNLISEPPRQTEITYQENSVLGGLQNALITVVGDGSEYQPLQLGNLNCDSQGLVNEADLTLWLKLNRPNNLPNPDILIQNWKTH